jgi:signal transduction histidine kinase
MLFILIAVGIVLLAALTVLLELRRERQQRDAYREILQQTPHYQQHRERHR